jgi:hypothetical protein
MGKTAKKVVDASKKRDESPTREEVSYRYDVGDWSEKDVDKCELEMSALTGMAKSNRDMLNDLTDYCCQLVGIRPTNLFETKPIELEWKSVNWRERPEIKKLLTSDQVLKSFAEMSPKFCLAKIGPVRDMELQLRELLNQIYGLYLTFFQAHGGIHLYPEELNKSFPFPWEEGRQTFVVPMSLFHESTRVRETGQPLEPILQTVSNSLEFVTALSANCVTAWMTPIRWYNKIRGTFPGPGRWNLSTFMEMGQNGERWGWGSYQGKNEEKTESLDLTGYFKFPLSLDPNQFDKNDEPKGTKIYSLSIY